MNVDRPRLMIGYILLGLGILAPFTYYAFSYEPVRGSYSAVLEAESLWALSHVKKHEQYTMFRDEAVGRFIVTASRRPQGDSQLENLGAMRLDVARKNAILRVIFLISSTVGLCGIAFLTVALLRPDSVKKAALAGMVSGGILGGVCGSIYIEIDEMYLTPVVPVLIWENNLNSGSYRTVNDVILAYSNDLLDARPQSPWDSVAPGAIVGVLVGAFLGAIACGFLGPNPDRRVIDARKYRDDSKDIAINSDFGDSNSSSNPFGEG